MNVDSDVARGDGMASETLAEFEQISLSDTHEEIEPVETPRSGSDSVSSFSGQGMEPSDSSKVESSLLAFAPTVPFKHTGLFLPLIVVGMFVSLQVGGKAMIVTLVSGLAVAYATEVLSLSVGPNHSLTVLGILVGTIGTSFLILLEGLLTRFPQSPLLTFPAAFSFQAFGGMVIIWVALQFQILQLQFPLIPPMLERMLFSCFTMPFAVVVTYGVVRSWSLSLGPWGLWAALVSCVSILGIPHETSFPELHGAVWGKISPERPARRSDRLILGFLETGTIATAALFVPVISLAFLHRMQFTWRIWSELMTMVFSAVLGASELGEYGSLWWTGVFRRSAANFQSTLLTVQLIAIGGLCGCIEIRFLYSALSPYMALTPHVSGLLLFVVLFSSAALFHDLLSGKQRIAYFWVLMVATVSIGFLFGFPFYIFPPLLAVAYFMGEFLKSRSLTAYFAFVIPATMVSAWWIHSTFWFLDFSFSSIDGLSLQTVCVLAVFLIVTSLMICGLAALNRFPVLTAMLLVCDGLVLGFVEWALNNQFEGMYSGVFVLVTSFLGIIVARRMVSEKRIPQSSEWILVAVFLSKLSIFLGPAGEEGISAYFWSLCLCLPLVRLWLFIPSSSLPPNSVVLRKNVARRISGMTAVVLLTFICTSLIGARDLFLFRVSETIGGVSRDEQTFATLLGSFLIAMSVAVIPLPFHYFRGSAAVRSSHLISVAMGLLLLLVHPRQSPFGNDEESWDEWSADIQPLWPAWLLLAGLSFSVVVVGLDVVRVLSNELFTFVAMILGGCFAGYLVGTELHGSSLIEVFVVFLFFTTVFAVYLDLISILRGQRRGRTTSSTRLRVFYISSLFSFLFVTFVFNWKDREHALVSLQRTAHPGIGAALRSGRISLEEAKAVLRTWEGFFTITSIYFGANVFIAMLCSMIEGSKISKTGTAHARHSADAEDRRTQISDLRRHSLGILVPTSIGSIAAIVSYVLGLQLTVLWDTMPRPVNAFILAPLLLLYAGAAPPPPRGRQTRLRDKQHTTRFFLPFLSIAINLVISTLYEVAGLRSIPEIIRDVFALLLSFPAIFFFLKFWYACDVISGFQWLLCFPLCLLAVIITDCSFTRWLAGSLFLGGLVVFEICRELKKSSLKLIV